MRVSDALQITDDLNHTREKAEKNTCGSLYMSLKK
jgi:hypothetical protein